MLVDFDVRRQQGMDFFTRLEEVLLCIILGVARYTDATVRYVPRFGGHGSIRFRYNRKKKRNLLCSISFHLF